MRLYSMKALAGLRAGLAQCLSCPGAPSWKDAAPGAMRPTGRRVRGPGQQRPRGLGPMEDGAKTQGR